MLKSIICIVQINYKIHNRKQLKGICLKFVDYFIIIRLKLIRFICIY